MPKLNPKVEEWLLNPPPGSKAAAAKEFGIDLTLLLRNLRLTPQERVEKLQQQMQDFENLRLNIQNGESKDFPKTFRLVEIFCNANVEFIICGEISYFIHSFKNVIPTHEFCYSQTGENLRKIVSALSSFKPRPRGFPEGLPYIFDETTLQNATNFTFATEIGDIDLLGEVSGVGTFNEVEANSVIMELLDCQVKVLSVEGLIKAKTAAGRPKDLLVLPELEALNEILKNQEDAK